MRPGLIPRVDALQMNPHDQPGYMRPVTHVTDERRNLLLEKRELLHSMSDLVLSHYLGGELRKPALHCDSDTMCVMLCVRHA